VSLPAASPLGQKDLAPRFRGSKLFTGGRTGGRYSWIGFGHLTGGTRRNRPPSPGGKSCVIPAIGPVAASSVVVATALAACSAAHAATQNWVPTGAGPYDYTLAANWNGGAGPVPAAADVANMQLDLAANQAVNFASSKSFYQLLIGDTTQTGGVYQNQTLSGSSLTSVGSDGSSGAGTILSQNGNNVINNNLTSTTSSSPGLTINVASGSLALGGTLNAGYYTFAGPGLKTLTGAGSVGTFPRWEVTGGTLRATVANGFASSAIVTAGAGTTVDLNNLNQKIRVLAGAGTFALGSATLTIEASLYNDPMIITGTGGITIDASDVSIYAPFVNTTNTMSGPLTIRSGNAQLTSAANMGNGGPNNKVIFAPGGQTTHRTLSTGTGVFNRDVVLNADAELYGSNTTFAGVISGSGSLSMGGQDVYLTGVNTYTGDTHVLGNGNFKALHVSADSALGAPSGGIILEPSGRISFDAAVTTSRSFTTNNSAFNGGVVAPSGVTFQGSGNDTFTGELWITPSSSTVSFSRTGGTTAVTPNALIWLAGSNLVLGGTVDALSDGVDHVNVRLSNGLPGGHLTVTQGAKNVGKIDFAGTVTVETGASLKVTNIRTTDLTSGVQVHGTGVFELRRNGYPEGTSKVQNISIDPAARFDIQDNGLVWDYATGAPVKAQARQYLINGRGGAGGNSPTWTSPGGIISTRAAIDGFPQLEAVGYVDNADVAGGPFTTWRGLTGIDSTSILICRTVPGDANLDFIVNNPDLNITGANYLQANVGDWYKGDYNYDGLVNDADVYTLGSGWNKDTTPPTQSSLTSQYGANFANAFYDGLAHPVPEPAAMTVLLAGTAITLARRRRL
jgi:hypothetical protein